MWQDYVISLCQVFFIIALSINVFAETKPNVYTSAITSISLGITSLTFYTLGLIWSPLSTAVCTLLWFILYIQEYKRINGLKKTIKEIYHYN